MAMYQARGTRKGQRFSITHSSRDSRFAAVKAALRKQSLTFEPYSEEVIHALWSELQERHVHGVFCMLRKGLQNALLIRLAKPLDEGRMSKNKVNKIFQVLIRSCFVLHSRMGHGEDDQDHLGSHEPMMSSGELTTATVHSSTSAITSLRSSSSWRAHGDTGEGGDSTATTTTTSSGDTTVGTPGSASRGNGSRSSCASAGTSLRVIETPGPTRPFSLEMDWTTPSDHAMVSRYREQQPEDHQQPPWCQHQLQLQLLGQAGNGGRLVEAQAKDKPLSWRGTPRTGIVQNNIGISKGLGNGIGNGRGNDLGNGIGNGIGNGLGDGVANTIENGIDSGIDSGGDDGDASSASSEPNSDSDCVSDFSLILTPQESSVFSRTGILPSTAASSPCDGGVSGERNGNGAGPGERNARRAHASRCSSADREVLRRLSLSPAGARKDLRRSVSSEDILAGLRIRMDRDSGGGDLDSPFETQSLTFGNEPKMPLVHQSAPEHVVRGLAIHDPDVTCVVNTGNGNGFDQGKVPKRSAAMKNTSEGYDRNVGVFHGGDAGMARAMVMAGGCDEEEVELVGAVCELREDVGSLEEVVLTHNAFIRKVASEAGIRLPAGDWAAFFGCDKLVVAELEAARSRPPSPLPPPQADPFGYMNKQQLYKFRTAWCNRSHPHVEEFCEHAHQEVNLGWLRRDPSKHPYLPRRCSSVILPGSGPGPGGRFIDECPKGRSCPAAHSLEEILYHPQAYKTQICPQGRKCRSKAFCPHAHLLLDFSISNDIAAVSVGMRRSASAALPSTGSMGDEASAVGPERVSMGSLRHPSCARSTVSPEQGGSGSESKRRSGEDERQTVFGRRGRRSPGLAEGEGQQTWMPPARVRSRSWSGVECWGPGGDIGGSFREFRRRAMGVTGLLAALRKRSADVMQPPSKHEELLRTIYSTLRRREPNGCDEKELVGRVFHASASSGKGDTTMFAGSGSGCGSGADPATVASQPDASDFHSFSKTKVRGAVTLLKFAQAVRVGRGEATGQHVLYVAHELATFSDFISRHNLHLIEMARELGVDMTPHDWKSLLDQDYAGDRLLLQPSPSPTNCSESSPSGESSSSSAAAAAARSPWTARSTAGSHRRSSPSPCPKPPQPHQLLQYQRCFTGMPMPSPPPRQGAAQSPAPQGLHHGLRNGQPSSSPSQAPFSGDGNTTLLPLRVAPRDSVGVEHVLWHDGQFLHLQQQQKQQQLRIHQEQKQQLTDAQRYAQVGPSQQRAPSPATVPRLGTPPPPTPSGAWGQTGPGGLAQRLQGVAASGSTQASSPAQTRPKPQAQHAQVGAGVGGMMGCCSSSRSGSKSNSGSNASPQPPHLVHPPPRYGLVPPQSQELTPQPLIQPQTRGPHDGSRFVLVRGGAAGRDRGHVANSGPIVVYGMMGGGGPGEFTRQRYQAVAGLGGAGGSGNNPCGAQAGGGDHQSYSRAMFSHRGDQGTSRDVRWMSGTEQGRREDGVSVGVRVARQEQPPGAGYAIGTPQGAHLQCSASTTPLAQTTTSDDSPGPSGNAPAPTNGGASISIVPVSVKRCDPLNKLRRQYSLPQLSEAQQPVRTPARMAQTPPPAALAASRLGFLTYSGGGVSGEGHGSRSKDAVAEVWGRERERPCGGARGSSPVESRITAVAITGRKMTESAGSELQVESDSESAAESAAVAIAESAVRSASPEAKGGPTSFSVNGEEQRQHGEVAGGDGNCSEDEISFAVRHGGRRYGRGAALPGLSDFASDGRSYNLF